MKMFWGWDRHTDTVVTNTCMHDCNRCPSLNHTGEVMSCMLQRDTAEKYQLDCSDRHTDTVVTNAWQRFTHFQNRHTAYDVHAWLLKTWKLETETKQDSLVLSMSAVWTRYKFAAFIDFMDDSFQSMWGLDCKLWTKHSECCFLVSTCSERHVGTLRSRCSRLFEWIYSTACSICLKSCLFTVTSMSDNTRHTTWKARQLVYSLTTSGVMNIEMNISQLQSHDEEKTCCQSDVADRQTNMEWVMNLTTNQSQSQYEL